MGKREIRAKQIMRDLKLGVTDDELMEKYRLTPKGLKSLFNKLLKAKLITKEEFDWRPTFWDDTVTISLDSLELSAGSEIQGNNKLRLMKGGLKGS
jgi:hypothetical protein